MTPIECPVPKTSVVPAAGMETGRPTTAFGESHHIPGTRNRLSFLAAAIRKAPPQAGPGQDRRRTQPYPHVENSAIGQSESVRVPLRKSVSSYRPTQLIPLKPAFSPAQQLKFVFRLDLFGNNVQS